MGIREGTPEDASSLITLFERLYGETKFLMLEPGEAVPPVERYADRIAQGSRGASEVWFVAEDEGHLIGVCFGKRGLAKRNRHSLFLVMGVVQASCGRGVGRALLRAIEEWAMSRAIHRLELTVNVTNTRAIGLYERFGFDREGTKRDSLFINGEYVNELYMAKLIAP
jgi:RimJ/RimL family protein N-acetyltransferase